MPPIITNRFFKSTMCYKLHCSVKGNYVELHHIDIRSRTYLLNELLFHKSLQYGVVLHYTLTASATHCSQGGMKFQITKTRNFYCIIYKAMTTMIKWRPSSLSELTPMLFNTGLT